MKYPALLAALLGWSGLCLPAAPAAPPVPRAVAFSPDGRTLAVGSADAKAGELTLWDVASRKALRRVAQPQPVRALAWTPDGKALIAAVGRSARLIDPGTGKPRGVLGRHDKAVTCLALTADGRTLAAGDDGGAVNLWDVAGGKELRSIAAHRGWVYSVCFAPDGKRLVSTADTEARLWDAGTGKELRKWTHGGFLVRSAVFTPDGKGAVTAGWDGTARLWDVGTGAVRARFGGLGGLDGVLLNPGIHTLALWGHGRMLALFDLDLRPPGAAVRRRIADLVERLDDDDYGVRESASRALVALGWVAEPALRKAAKSASAEVRIRARSALAALQAQPRKVLKAVSGDVRAACFSADGKLLAAGAEDGTVRLWDPATGREVACLGR